MTTLSSAAVLDSVSIAPRPFADRRLVMDEEKCRFYHTMDLPSGHVTGDWDLRGRVHEYIGGVDVAGRSVLDVGTASGYLTFEMEKMGGRIVSFDAESARDINFVPVHDQVHITDYSTWARDADAFLDRLKNSYWYTHRELGSHSEALYGNIYSVAEYGHSFDVAVLGQILVHLKDPVGALAAVAAVCKDTLIITEGTVDSPHPDMRLCARATAGGPGYMWWLCSVPFYREVLGMQNFEITQVTKRPFRCDRAPWTGDIELTTIVARRR
jgi:hypothetical protein